MTPYESLAAVRPIPPPLKAQITGHFAIFGF